LKGPLYSVHAARSKAVRRYISYLIYEETAQSLKKKSLAVFTSRFI